MDCGYRGQTLRRHISTRHSMSRDAYLKRWGLRSNHPLTAPNYSERRSTMAKTLGLGRKPAAHATLEVSPPVREGAEATPSPRRKSRPASKSADVASAAVAATPNRSGDRDLGSNLRSLPKISRRSCRTNRQDPQGCERANTRFVAHRRDVALVGPPAQGILGQTSAILIAAQQLIQRLRPSPMPDAIVIFRTSQLAHGCAPDSGVAAPRPQSLPTWRFRASDLVHILYRVDC